MTCGLIPGYVGGTPSVTDSDGQTYAVFGQGTYTLFQKLDLTAGLRATFDDRSINGAVVNALGSTPVPCLRPCRRFLRRAAQVCRRLAFHTPNRNLCQRRPGLSERRLQFLPQQKFLSSRQIMGVRIGSQEFV